MLRLKNGRLRPSVFLCRKEKSGRIVFAGKGSGRRGKKGAGQAIDRKQVTFGFRTAEFRADGFYLNGKKTFLRGLNRHQSFPYIGYAAPESLQREDARILQEELHCTAVRTSHYPQSQYFLDECDRRGLLSRN